METEQKCEKCQGTIIKSLPDIANYVGRQFFRGTDFKQQEKVCLCKKGEE